MDVKYKNYNEHPPSADDEKEIISYYFKKGYKWRLHHNIEISIRTLKRPLQTYGLQRKICNITEDSLKQIISKVSYRTNIKRDVEMKLLRKVDPNGS